MASIKRPGYDHLLKLIIIGDSSVGKTWLLLRFSEDNFPTTHMPTIGKLKQIITFLTEFWSIALDAALYSWYRYWLQD